jgi:hypothetical protein
MISLNKFSYKGSRELLNIDYGCEQWSLSYKVIVTANKEQLDTRACRGWPAGDSSDAKVNSQPFLLKERSMDVVLNFFVLLTCLTCSPFPYIQWRVPQGSFNVLHAVGP